MYKKSQADERVCRKIGKTDPASSSGGRLLVKLAVACENWSMAAEK